MNDTDGKSPEGDFAPLDALTKIEFRDGRWIVYLNVPTWDSDDEQHPIRNHWKQINDFASEQQARVAAHWYERSANRSVRPPTGF